jgi:hypothetical protein
MRSQVRESGGGLQVWAQKRIERYSLNLVDRRETFGLDL